MWKATPPLPLASLLEGVKNTWKREREMERQRELGRGTKKEGETERDRDREMQVGKLFSVSNASNISFSVF